MKVFISYKYTNHCNKEELKQKLGEISTLIESWGDSTFVLGRDIKKWRHIHFGALTMLPVIYKNMKLCDLVYVYIDSEVFSKGMMMELLIAKLLNKKTYLFTLEGVNPGSAKNLVHTTRTIKNIHDISKLY